MADSEFPTTSKWVDCTLFHPEFVRRLHAMFADPRIKGRAKIVSGGRTYNQQKALYTKYKNGKGNLAANPDRRFGPKGLNGVGIWRGRRGPGPGGPNRPGGDNGTVGILN